MKRVGLVVAYDGTNYSGWQIQPNGITIEEILNRQISKLTGDHGCKPYRCRSTRTWKCSSV